MGTFNILPSAMVGEQGPNDGQIVYPRAGNYGQEIVDNLMGKYFELNKRGRVWCAATGVAGVVLPIYTATAQKFVLWNQAAIGINVVPLLLEVSTMGTPAVSSSLGITTIIGAGTALGTPISAFTATLSYNMKTLQPGAAYAKFSVAATVVAPTAYIDLGISQAGVLAAASTTTQWVKLHHDFDGTMIIQPQNAICICGAIAQTATLVISLYYAEVPA